MENTEEKVMLADMMAEELGSEMDAISEMEIGSEQQSKAIDNLAALAKIRQDLIKSDVDNNFEQEKLNFEKEKFEYQKVRDNNFEQEKLNFEKEKFEYQKVQDNKKAQAEKRDKIVDYVLTAAGIIIPAALGIARIHRDNKWMAWGFEYEKTGAITSKTFNSLLKHFNSPRE